MSLDDLARAYLAGQTRSLTLTAIQANDLLDDLGEFPELINTLEDAANAVSSDEEETILVIVKITK